MATRTSIRRSRRDRTGEGVDRLDRVAASLGTALEEARKYGGSALRSAVQDAYAAAEMGGGPGLADMVSEIADRWGGTISDAFDAALTDSMDALKAVTTRAARPLTTKGPAAVRAAIKKLRSAANGGKDGQHDALLEALDALERALKNGDMGALMNAWEDLHRGAVTVDEDLIGAEFDELNLALEGIQYGKSARGLKTRRGWTPMTEEQAAAIIDAFGPNSTVYETMSPADLLRGYENTSGTIEEYVQGLFDSETVYSDRHDAAAYEQEETGEYREGHAGKVAAENSRFIASLRERLAALGYHVGRSARGLKTRRYLVDFRRAAKEILDLGRDLSIMDGDLRRALLTLRDGDLPSYDGAIYIATVIGEFLIGMIESDLPEGLYARLDALYSDLEDYAGGMERSAKGLEHKGLPPFDFFKEYDWDWEALADEVEGSLEFPGLADALRSRDSRKLMSAIRSGSGNTRGMSRDLKDMLDEFESWMAYKKPRKSAHRLERRASKTEAKFWDRVGTIIGIIEGQVYDNKKAERLADQLEQARTDQAPMAAVPPLEALNRMNYLPDALYGAVEAAFAVLPRGKSARSLVRKARDPFAFSRLFAEVERMAGPAVLPEVKDQVAEAEDALERGNWRDANRALKAIADMIDGSAVDEWLQRAYAAVHEFRRAIGEERSARSLVRKAGPADAEWNAMVGDVKRLAAKVVQYGDSLKAEATELSADLGQAGPLLDDLLEVARSWLSGARTNWKGTNDDIGYLVASIETLREYLYDLGSDPVYNDEENEAASKVGSLFRKFSYAFDSLAKGLGEAVTTSLATLQQGAPDYAELEQLQKEYRELSVSIRAAADRLRRIGGASVVEAAEAVLAVDAATQAPAFAAAANDLLNAATSDPAVSRQYPELLDMIREATNGSDLKDLVAQILSYKSYADRGLVKRKMVKRGREEDDTAMAAETLWDAAWKITAVFDDETDYPDELLQAQSLLIDGYQTASAGDNDWKRMAKAASRILREIIGRSNKERKAKDCLAMLEELDF